MSHASGVWERRANGNHNQHFVLQFFFRRSSCNWQEYKRDKAATMKRQTKAVSCLFLIVAPPAPPSCHARARTHTLCLSLSTLVLLSRASLISFPVLFPTQTYICLPASHLKAVLVTDHDRLHSATCVVHQQLHVTKARVSALGTTGSLEKQP